MADYLRNGVEWLKDQLDESIGETIRYLRGDVTLTGITAWKNSEEIEQVADGEVTLVGKRCVWELDPTELVLDGVVSAPRERDLIEWDDGETTNVYEVLPSRGESAGRTGDVYGNWIRISTKFVGSR